MIGIAYAGDVARDLGFDGIVPEFWEWCRERGLEPLPDKPLGFDPEAVREAAAWPPSSPS